MPALARRCVRAGITFQRFDREQGKFSLPLTDEQFDTLDDVPVNRPFGDLTSKMSETLSS